MRVELARPLKRAIRKAGYAAVVVVEERGSLCHRVQAAENVGALLPALQAGNPRPLEIADLVWTPGLITARTIVVGTEAQLAAAGRRIAPHWFDIELDAIQVLIGRQACSLHCPIWTHDGLIAEIARHQAEDMVAFEAGLARRLFEKGALSLGRHRNQP